MSDIDLELTDHNIKFIINYLNDSNLNYKELDNNLSIESLKNVIIEKLPKESIIKLLEIQKLKEEKQQLYEIQEKEMKNLLKSTENVFNKEEEKIEKIEKKNTKLNNILKKYEDLFDNNHNKLKENLNTIDETQPINQSKTNIISSNYVSTEDDKIKKELDELSNTKIKCFDLINKLQKEANFENLLENDRIKRKNNYLEQKEIEKIREKYKVPYTSSNNLKKNVFDAFKSYKRTIDLSRDDISYYKNEQRDRPIAPEKHSTYRIPYAKKTLDNIKNENKPLTFRERMEKRLKDIGINKNQDDNIEEPKFFVKLINKNYEDTEPNRPSLKLLIDKLKEKYINNTRYDKDEMDFYTSLNDEKKNKIDKLEHKISKINNIKTPLRFRILSSNLTIKQKSIIINKLENLTSNKMFGSSEITKYSNWVTSLLRIPFKKYKELPINNTSTEKDVGDYLINVKDTLDSAVYGHEKTKEQILQVLAQWISNPESVGNFISIEGPAGNGKTTLVKNGIAKAIGRPFAFISLGGATDSAFLDGHSFTYEGSMYGKIADILMNCGCMNPVFYFDELDKISKSQKGDELSNLLIHLTDSSQNDQFNDKYFNGITFDLSKALFIFSYNNRENVNPILLDRLINIQTKGFKMDDKIKIANDYLIPDICDMLSMKKDNINLDEDTLKFIIKEFTGEEEGGVRSLKKVLYNIYSRINLLNLTKHNSDIKYTFDTDIKKNDDNNIILDEDTLKKLIENDKEEDEKLPPSIEHLYM